MPHLNQPIFNLLQDLSISVIVPTYRRPKDLAVCLEALSQQTRPADEILVIVRDSDVETSQWLATYHGVQSSINMVKVTNPGVVAALNAGLDVAQGDIMAITDDDAAPRPEWLARIEAHFLADKSVGGVGGKDWKYQGTEVIRENRAVVGRVQWFGRIIGNHNFGFGQPREVEFLKGVNMSYRRQAIADLRFDERLRGTGAQVHNDLAFSLKVKQSGWKLIYDPLVEVDHYHSQRFDEDQRHQFNYLAMVNKVHNETLTLLNYLPPLGRLAFLIWGILIGTRDHWGLAQCLRFLPSQGNLAIQTWFASAQGQYQGWKTWKASLPPTPAPIGAKENIGLLPGEIE